MRREIVDIFGFGRTKMASDSFVGENLGCSPYQEVLHKYLLLELEHKKLQEDYECLTSELEHTRRLLFQAHM
jgi:hypothetical protein